MTIEIDQHPMEGLENDLKALLLKYDLQDVKKAVSNLNLSPEAIPSRLEVVMNQRVGKVMREYILVLPTLDVAETTQKDYKELARRFSRFCHTNLPDRLDTKFSEVLTRQVISKWINWKCPAPTAKSTRNKTVAFTRSFLRKVLGSVPKELLDALQFHGLDDTLPKAYTNAQVEEMLEISRLGGNNFRNHTILNVLIGSGIRVRELSLLQIKDVNFSDETIKVRPKGARGARKTRYVNSDSFAVLKNYITYTFGDPKFLAEDDDRYVFTGIGRKTAMSVRTIEKMINGLMEQCQTITKAQKKQLNVHSFRHFFAVSQLRNGVDIYTISILLGHQSVRSTEVYLRLFNEDLRKAVNGLNLTCLNEKQLVLIQGMGGKEE